MQLPQDRGTYVLSAVAVCVLLVADLMTDVVEQPSSPSQPPRSSTAVIGQLVWGLPLPLSCRTGEALPRAPSVLLLSPWGRPVADARVRVEVVHVRHLPPQRWRPIGFDCSTENLQLFARTAAWLSWAQVACTPTVVRADTGTEAVWRTEASGVATLSSLQLRGPPGLYTLRLTAEVANGGGRASAAVLAEPLTAAVQAVSEVATLEVVSGSEPPATAVFGEPIGGGGRGARVAAVLVRSGTGRPLAGRRVVALACAGGAARINATSSGAPCGGGRWGGHRQCRRWICGAVCRAAVGPLGGIG